MSTEYKDFVDYKKDQLTTNSSRYLGYNNQFQSLPPHMHDGRIMTNSWQPGAENNEQIIKENNITTSWEYRQFMINNANMIRNFNYKEACFEMGCENFEKAYAINSNKVNEEYSVPYRYTSNNDNTVPQGYVQSDLKSAYLSREELESRKIAPAITQEELLKIPR
mgnify:CR=1 FL=1